MEKVGTQLVLRNEEEDWDVAVVEVVASNDVPRSLQVASNGAHYEASQSGIEDYQEEASQRMKLIVELLLLTGMEWLTREKVPFLTDWIPSS